MNDIAVSGGFAVARTNKAGKTTYRGALGVMSSGNVSERHLLAAEAFGFLVANNNYRAIMREIGRIWSTASIKKASNVLVDGDNLYFRSGNGNKIDLELFDPANPNKTTAHAFANAVLEVTATKELKGEKLLYATMLRKMVDNESARLTAAIAAEMERLETADEE